MTALTTRLKLVDHASKMIVNGFLRQSQTLLPFERNPYFILIELIVQICLIYYARIEFWDLLDSNFITQENGTILKS